MLLLNVFAVFWTADIMEEKKPLVGFPGEAWPFSGVGVRGASVMLDSLLGMMLADPALPLRWFNKLPELDASDRSGLVDGFLACFVWDAK
jgi:hypothetical protein